MMNNVGRYVEYAVSNEDDRRLRRIQMGDRSDISDVHIWCVRNHEKIQDGGTILPRPLWADGGYMPVDGFLYMYHSTGGEYGDTQ